jgi:hypothetical protein
MGVWPLPEMFAVSAAADKLPPRDHAHPTLYFAAADSLPSVPSGFPVDKYDVEHCGLHAMLLQTHGNSACWQVRLTKERAPVRVPCFSLRCTAV